MNSNYGLCHPGVLAALGAALLFGSGTPIAKLLLFGINPWLLAGLLYLGSGLGLALYRFATHATAGKLLPGEWPWLLGAILSGGIIAPVLLMFGLTSLAASEASLMLNAEGVFTVLLAWFVFHEHFDRYIVLGMIAIIAGAVVLSWPGEAGVSGVWPVFAVLGACLSWGIDNNLTRKVSMSDATWIASMKGLAAGSVNLVLAFITGASLPPLANRTGALVGGWLAYGVSLSLFVIGLRHLGTARTGAYFSVAPFFGAVLSIPLLSEPVSLRLLIAGAFMALGVWLHLSEHHIHPHSHESIEHEHEHIHEEDHQHSHEDSELSGKKHAHIHKHENVKHIHVHYPDIQHRHKH
jgi:drug/metabolite transporter (DMT)-like permease